MGRGSTISDLLLDVGEMGVSKVSGFKNFASDFSLSGGPYGTSADAINPEAYAQRRGSSSAIGGINPSGNTGWFGEVPAAIRAANPSGTPGRSTATSPRFRDPVATELYDPPASMRGAVLGLDTKNLGTDSSMYLAMPQYHAGQNRSLAIGFSDPQSRIAALDAPRGSNNAAPRPQPPWSVGNLSYGPGEVLDAPVGSNRAGSRFLPPKKGTEMIYSAPEVPSITMPKPSGLAYGGPARVPSSGQPSSASVLSIGAGQVGTAVASTFGMGLVGGTASYMTGGNFGQGAIAGAMVGAGGYGMHHAARQAVKSGFSSGVTSFVQPMATTAGRNAMMLAGAGLGGGMFGGRRSHKRGFNANRGNSFGR